MAKILVLYFSMCGHTTLLHHGKIIVGVPYSCREIMNMSEITGALPYAASTLAGGDGTRQPSENELKIARFQGARVAKVEKNQPNEHLNRVKLTI